MAQSSKAEVQEVSKLSRWLPWIFILVGIIGLLSSIVIMQDKLSLLENPSFRPNCNLNPIISCGSVMQSHQATSFGFANPYIGLLGFPVVLTIGVAMLAGATFKTWFWRACIAGLGLGIVFAYWLLYQSIYTVGALCPYCLAVDVSLTILFWYLVLHAFREGWLPTSKKWLKKAVAFSHSHHLDLLVGWFLLVTAVILQHFWYYFGSAF